jgi:syntaxin-binding protein 5
MAFWAYSDADKPLTVRTITHEDVNVTDAESLFSAGVLDNQIRKENDVMTANREPVFKLAWVHFPDQAELKLLVATAGADGTSQQISNATHDYAERGETLLVLLGGQSAGEKPGINILQFPAYAPPLAKKGPQSPSQALPAQERYAYRDSLMPTGTSYYPTPTPPEDFILMPRSNPYFNNCHDPTAIIVTLTPDPTLSKVNAPTGERGVEAWVFPPPRSTVAPPSPGRKSFAVPGEDDKLVAMTPAPMMSSNPTSPRSPSPAAGWRLPWTASPSSRVGSPTLRVPASPDSAAGSAMSPFGPKRIRNRRRYRLPSSLWTGASSVLGCQVYSLSTANFKRLISHSIEFAGQEDEPRLPLYGGAAAPDLQSHGAPDVKVSKLESYRVLATYHADATVRFWDVSPHLLLLPTPLRFEYPGPLPHLTISIPEYLKGLDVAHLPLAKLWETDKSAVRIKSVHLAREALECVITMVTGEVVVTKFGESKKNAHDDTEELDDSPVDSYFPTNPASGMPSASKQEWIEEVTEIGHLAKWKHDGFKPVAIFTLKRGEAIACAVSDIGESCAIRNYSASAHCQASLRYLLPAIRSRLLICVDRTSSSEKVSTRMV